MVALPDLVRSCARLLLAGACMACMTMGAGCLRPGGGGGGGVAAQALGQPRPALDWATQFLGAPPQEVSVLRPFDGMDRLEMDRADAPSPLDWAMKHCRQVDGYSSKAGSSETSALTGDLVVMHGVPAWLDPLRPYPVGPSAKWQYVGPAASGVRAYRAEGPHDVLFQLFVLPSSTWVLSSGVAAQRLGWALASAAPEPPWLDLLPGAFMQTTVLADPERIARSGIWVRDASRIVAGGEVGFPPGPDGALVVGAFMVFADEGSARDSGEDAARLLADPASRDRLMGGGMGHYAGVQTVGRAVIIKTALGGH